MCTHNINYVIANGTVSIISMRIRPTFLYKRMNYSKIDIVIPKIAADYVYIWSHKVIPTFKTVSATSRIKRRVYKQFISLLLS